MWSQTNTTDETYSNGGPLSHTGYYTNTPTQEEIDKVQAYLVSLHKPRKTNTFREKLLYFPDRIVKHLHKPTVVESSPKDVYFLKKIKCCKQWSGKNFKIQR